MLSALPTFSFVFMLSLSGNSIVSILQVSILQVKKLRRREVKQLAPSLTALGGSPGSEPQQYDSRAMLLTTSLRELWGAGFSALCLAQPYTGGLDTCQLSAFPGHSLARRGSVQSFHNFQITYCEPSGSRLELNQLCAWGRCNCDL